MFGARKPGDSPALCYRSPNITPAEKLIILQLLYNYIRAVFQDSTVLNVVLDNFPARINNSIA